MRNKGSAATDNNSMKLPLDTSAHPTKSQTTSSTMSPNDPANTNANRGESQLADESALWHANDVAHFIGASRSWVYHQAEAGRLPCIRLLGFLRFDPRAVRAFVQAASSSPAKTLSGDASRA